MAGGSLEHCEIQIMIKNMNKDIVIIIINYNNY